MNLRCEVVRTLSHLPGAMKSGNDLVSLHETDFTLGVSSVAFAEVAPEIMEDAAFDMRKFVGGQLAR